MHRMRRLLVSLALAVSSLSLAGQSASAALLNPNADRTFPDVSADINGQVNYHYNPTTATGVFNVTNTPYLIAANSTLGSEISITPTADGQRSQDLNVVLDANGNIVANNPGNTYSMYGTITAGGQTFTGLLLQGTPTAFGSQSLASLGIQGSSIFDVNLNITGGALAPYFGTTAYIRITPELQSTFTGLFNTDFSAVKATSNTRPYNPPPNFPFPSPEPATLLVLLAGGTGLLAQHRRRKQIVARG